MLLWMTVAINIVFGQLYTIELDIRKREATSTNSILLGKLTLQLSANSPNIDSDIDPYV